MNPFRIATRGSKLAMRQANLVADLLRPALAPRAIELVLVQTTGDTVFDAPLTAIGGQGVFTKEVQQAVLDGRADLAVHSLKDLPTVAVPGLLLAATPMRASTADVLIAPKHGRFDALPMGAIIATGSSRRRAQVLRRRPDLQLTEVRGNVETRLRKLHEQNLDGIILAEAGLERLGLAGAVSEILDAQWMLPAVGQGALGLECRESDPQTRQWLQTINHSETYQAVLAERAFLRGLGGGCLLPIAALATVQAGRIRLRGAVFSPDGCQALYGEREGTSDLAESLGQALADQLLERGARELLIA